MKRLLLPLVVLLALAAGASAQQQQQQQQQRRTALIIGNGAYAGSAPLKNPANDARDVAAALSQLGFEVVNRQKMVDLTQKEMLSAVRAFGQRIRGGGVGLFFYAGHGMQVGGSNYLIPIDAKINNEGDVKYQSIDVSDVLIEMENANNGVNIIILDACRNNPFAARGFRSATNGLAQMNAPSGTLIAYATAPGSVASDGGDGRNGLYTRELIRALKTPGLPIEEVFKHVRVSVRDKTGRAQIPWESTSLDASFYFLPGNPAQVAANAPPPAPQRPAASAPPPVTAPAEEQAAGGGADAMEAVRRWGAGGKRGAPPAGAGHEGTFANLNDSNSSLRLSADGTFTLRQPLARGQYVNLSGNYLVEGETLTLFVDAARAPRYAGRGERMQCRLSDGGDRLDCHDGSVYVKR